jgi:hypothetical protein
MVYEETADTLKANGGANIGTESDQRKVTDEGVQFYAADGENPFMMLAKGLSEADGVNNMNQAFYIRFKASAKDFGFMLSSATSVGITIGDDAEPCVFIWSTIIWSQWQPPCKSSRTTGTMRWLR